MNTKTMEGLAGARTNVNLMDTPVQIFKDARRRGDTAAMERAMGYAGEFADRTEEYQLKADRGMEEDAEEAKEKLEAERGKMIERRKEKHEETQARIDESKSTDAGKDMVEIDADTVEISNGGNVSAKDNKDTVRMGPDEAGTDHAEKPVIYTKTGEVLQTEPPAGISITV